MPHSALNDVPVTHQRLRDIRRLLDSYPGDRVIVGEVFLLSTEKVAEYYGHQDELHLSFNFPPLFAPWWERQWRRCIAGTVQALEPRDAWPTWVLSNHDNPRHRSRYDSAARSRGEPADVTERRSELRARSAAVLLLTLRGTPFVYQGEELGLVDAFIPPERAVDPGGTGRMPGAAPLGRYRRSRVANRRRRRSLAPLPRRIRRPATMPPSAPTRDRYSTSTATDRPPAADIRLWLSVTSRGSRAPTACWLISGRSMTTSAQ